MSRNKEKQNNLLNRLYLSKQNRTHHVKRPALSQVNDVDELRRWLKDIEREIQMTLDMTKSVRYTDTKVESMYKRISELQIEHKRFRRKIGELELGPNVCVITQTIPVEKSIDFYKKKDSSSSLEPTLDEFFASKPSIPLLDKVEYRPTVSISTSSSFGSTNDQPLEFRSSLVNYSDSDD